MKLTFAALIIAFLVTASVLGMTASVHALAAPAQAQSVRTLSIRELVELSRGERARRTAETVEGRVYTSEDIERFVAPVPESETGDTEGDEPELAEDGLIGGGDAIPGADAVGDPDAEGDLVEVDPEAVWMAWQAEIRAQTAEIQSLEDQIVSQTLTMNEVEAIVTAPTGSQQARNQAMTELASARTTLEQLEQSLTETSAELNLLLSQDPGLED